MCLWRQNEFICLTNNIVYVRISHMVCINLQPQCRVHIYLLVIGSMASLSFQLCCPNTCSCTLSLAVQAGNLSEDLLNNSQGVNDPTRGSLLGLTNSHLEAFHMWLKRAQEPQTSPVVFVNHFVCREMTNDHDSGL